MCARDFLIVRFRHARVIDLGLVVVGVVFVSARARAGVRLCVFVRVCAGIYYMFYTSYGSGGGCGGNSVLLSLATTLDPTLSNGWTHHGAVFPWIQARTLTMCAIM